MGVFDHVDADRLRRLACAEAQRSVHSLVVFTRRGGAVGTPVAARHGRCRGFVQRHLEPQWRSRRFPHLGVGDRYRRPCGCARRIPACPGEAYRHFVADRPLRADPVHGGDGGFGEELHVGPCDFDVADPQGNLVGVRDASAAPVMRHEQRPRACVERDAPDPERRPVFGPRRLREGIGVAARPAASDVGPGERRRPQLFDPVACFGLVVVEHVRPRGGAPGVDLVALSARDGGLDLRLRLVHGVVIRGDAERRGGRLFGEGHRCRRRAVEDASRLRHRDGDRQRVVRCARPREREYRPVADLVLRAAIGGGLCRERQCPPPDRLDGQLPALVPAPREASGLQDLASIHVEQAIAYRAPAQSSGRMVELKVHLEAGSAVVRRRFL